MYVCYMLFNKYSNTLILPNIHRFKFFFTQRFSNKLFLIYFFSVKNSNNTHPFNDPLSGTTRVNRHQKVKTNLDFTDAKDSE